MIKAKYLIVAEDSHLFRTLLIQLLEKMNFQSLPCEDGVKALETLRSNEDKDIVGVVSDIYMPNMDGMDLLKAVRSETKFKNLPFIMITSESEPESMKSALKAGATEYLVKPLSMDQFYKKMQSIFPDITRNMED